jgi:uncharacterized protein YbjT (DUF2867 family)
MRVALIGGSGLIGASLAPLLVAAGHEVHRLQRRASEGPGAQHIAEPGGWPALVAEIRPEAAISALGTTMRKAGSEAGFRAVDLDMVVAFAAAAKAAGARQMLTVSSVGADSGSRAFYLRTKAEMEQALEGLGFERLDIFRPGLLRGARGGERRLGERLGIAVSPIVNLVLRGPLDRFAAIDADVVARAIAAALEPGGKGLHIHHNPEIRRLAKRPEGF